MNKYLFTIMMSVLFFAIASASAQDIILPEGYELQDSLIAKPAPTVDSALVGKSIFSVMPTMDRVGSADVKVHQSQAIRSALETHVASNASKPMSGYRIRIFFDNRQSARVASESALSRFKSLNPGIAAYRSFTNPYFKVTVGDFRSKSEAMALLMEIKGEFPSSFIVRENIRYPVIDARNPCVIDTVKVVRPIKQKLL